MAKNIEPNLKLLSSYISLEKDLYFSIPEYQRAYSWGREQCDKLWQDIELFIESNGTDPYFFGTIIVDCSEDDKFNLIDGQQRTTTFILLLKALLIRIIETLKEMSKDEETESLRAGLNSNRDKIIKILYKIEDEDIPAFLKNSNPFKDVKIFENKSINEMYKDEVNKIVKADDFEEAEKNTSKIPRKQKDNKYTSHFKNFKYFYEKLQELSESKINEFAKTILNKCQVIEIRSWQIEQAIVMFNSLNSTGLPLADADIISAKLYSNIVNTENEETFKQTWKEIIEKATNLKTQEIVDIDSILSQYMYIIRAKDNINDVTMPSLRRYYVDIKKELLDDPVLLCNNLKNLVDKWDKVKNYQIIKLALKFNENIKLFLASFLYRFEEEDLLEGNITELTECLIRLFAVLELVDYGYSSKNFKSFLFNENIKLVSNKIDTSEIVKDFNVHINSIWENENIKDFIKEYDTNILVYLNEYLYAKEKNSYFNIDGTINIEHIMPDSGKNISSIREDANITDIDEFNSIVNKLGNKVLLEEDINKSISNEWFKVKKQSSIEEKRGYKNSKFAIANSLISYPSDKWTKEDIEIITEKIANRFIDFIFGESKDTSTLPSKE